MIKINLSSEQKEELEKIFLMDLYGDYDCNDNYHPKKGKIIKILGTDENRELLRDNFPTLYDYFYDDAGNINKDKVKSLLLADREKMKELIEKIGPCDDKKLSDTLLNKIFQYGNFSKRETAYNICHKQGVTVCPYCNRSYIMTLEKNCVRPQFDHYFPKSIYPYLALSLYNLIPSCSICNMAKSNMDTYKTPILYPYEEEFGEEAVFVVGINNNDQFVKYMRGNSSEFQVTLNSTGHVLKDQIESQNDTLHITELYNEHKDYITDIFKNYHINTPKRVEELLKNFPELFSTEEEIRSLIFMNDIRHDNWGKRPLAKLTHDIYTELKSIS